MNACATRREFLRLSAVAAVGTLLAACAPQAGAPAVVPAKEEKAPAVPPSAAGTITVWGWAGTVEGLQSQVEPFKQKFPDVQIDIKVFGYEDVHTNLLNSIIAGSGAPDLCAIDVLRLTQYVDGLVDLTESARQYFDQFVPPTVSLGSYKGKFYGLATDSEPMGLYYRKDLWDQYGIQEENINTWSDLAAASAKVQEASQGQVSLYAMQANEVSLFEVLAVEQGFVGYYFNEDDTKVIVDDPKIVEAVEVLKQLWDGKGVLRNPGSYTSSEMTVLLKSGKVASQIIGPAWWQMTLKQEMPELAGRWRIMRAPAVKQDGPRVGYQYPTIFVMPQQAKFKEAAWEFARMGLIGEGARALFEATLIMPAYQPLLDELKDKPEEYFGGQKVYELWDAIARDTPQVFFGTGFIEAQQIFGNQLQAILNGEKTIEAGLHDAAEEMRVKLKKG